MRLWQNVKFTILVILSAAKDLVFLISYEIRPLGARRMTGKETFARDSDGNPLTRN
jgi:hypothetical protein